MTKSKFDINKFLFGVILGIVTIYGLFIFLLPETYQIIYLGKLSPFIGLVMFVLGLAGLGRLLEK